MRRRKLAYGGFLAATLLALSVVAGCDSTASLYLSEVQWNELVVMSAVPMKKVLGEDGQVDYVPLCRMQDEAADGLLLRILFKGTQQIDSPDRDQSIRPGDRIDLKEVTTSQVNPGKFELAISCIEKQLPGAAQCNTNADCEDCEDGKTCDVNVGKGFCVDGMKSCYSGIQTGDVQISRVGFREFTPSRGENVGVAILVDMSGSNKGFVKPFPPYYEVNNEDPSGVHDDVFMDFAQRASDIAGTRMNAVKTIIKNLNADDKFIVFTFREYGIDVVCELPGDDTPDNDTKKDNCFGSNRSYVLGDGDFGPLDDVKPNVGGRSPLWTAVEQVYEYMDTHKRTKNTKYKHIVVINDGPDTCSESSSLDQCSGSCAQFSTSFDTVRTMVEGIPFESRIPIHFIQYQAMGYLDRDPRQQEIACLTSGHHLFLNSDDFAAESLANEFNRLALNLRYTFGGYWEFAIEMTKLGEDNSLPRGWNYGVGGTGKILALKDKLLVNTDGHFSFEIENDSVDMRVSLRKDCKTDADCPASVSGGNCTTRTWWCDDDTLECNSAVDWAENGTEAAACGEVDAVVRVQVRYIDSGLPTETKEASLGQLPSFCCNGACTPPMPPLVPDDIAKSGGTICFEYDNERGWVWDENQHEWVYWAELYIKADCATTWIGLKPELAYGVNENPAVADLTWEAHWDCPDKQNCFPPPGAGD